MPEPWAVANDDGWEQSHNATRRRNRLVWLLSLAAAVVCFELTANPALSVALGCLKFGWHDFQLGHRLKRADPNRARGRVCARFYVAWGLWKISIVATGLMFGAAILSAFILGRNRNPNPPVADPAFIAFMTACGLATLGFGLSAIVTSFAALSALRHRIRVWVGEQDNQVKKLLMSALITHFTVLGLFLAIAFGGQIFAQPRSPAFVQALVFGVLFGVPVMIVTVLGTLEHRIVATSPEQCWPDPLDWRAGAAADRPSDRGR